jgi:hypothetical protein
MTEHLIIFFTIKPIFPVDIILNGWIFNEEFEYLDENLRGKFKYVYNILSHSYFNAKYVLFKSSPVLGRISGNERPPDQYENRYFKELIAVIYDTVSSLVLDIGLEEVAMVIDTLEILKNNPALSTIENDEGIYDYCKLNKDVSSGFIADFIAEKLYNVFKDK